MRPDNLLWLSGRSAVGPFPPSTSRAALMARTPRGKPLVAPRPTPSHHNGARSYRHADPTGLVESGRTNTAGSLCAAGVAPSPMLETGQMGPLSRCRTPIWPNWLYDLPPAPSTTRRLEVSDSLGPRGTRRPDRQPGPQSRHRRRRPSRRERRPERSPPGRHPRRGRSASSCPG